MEEAVSTMKKKGSFMKNYYKVSWKKRILQQKAKINSNEKIYIEIDMALFST